MSKRRKRKKSKSRRTSNRKAPTQKHTTQSGSQLKRNNQSKFIKSCRTKVKGFLAGGFLIVVAFFADILDIGDHFFTKEDKKEIFINITCPSVTEQPTDLSQINALYTQGNNFFVQGDYEQAIIAYSEALNSHSSETSVDVNTARIQYAMGLAYKYSGSIDESITMYTKALGTLQSLFDTYNTTDSSKSDNERNLSNEIGYVHYLRGVAYEENKDFQRALEDCKTCFEIISNIKIDNNSKYYFDFASVFSLKGKIYADSYYCSHSPMVDMPEKDMGYTLSDALYCLNNAVLYKVVRLNDNTERLDDFSQNDSAMAEILTDRAQILLMMGSYDKAIDDCEAALKIYENLSFSKRYNIYKTYRILAYTKLYNGSNNDGSIDETAIADVHKYLEKGLNHNIEWYGEYHFITAVSYENMGMADSFSGKYEAAIEDYRNAGRIFKKLGFEEDAEKQQAFINSIEEAISAGGDEWRAEFLTYSEYLE